MFTTLIWIALAIKAIGLALETWERIQNRTN